MAEGFAKKYLHDIIIYSAGTNPEAINPLAVKVMKEINIDISLNYSKSISEKEISTFDIVVTLCGHAKDSCISLSNFTNKHIHWNIKDPAKADGSENDKLTIFRKSRSEIKKEIKNLKNRIFTKC